MFCIIVRHNFRISLWGMSHYKTCITGPIFSVSSVKLENSTVQCNIYWFLNYILIYVTCFTKLENVNAWSYNNALGLVLWNNNIVVFFNGMNMMVYELPNFFVVQVQYYMEGHLVLLCSWFNMQLDCIYPVFNPLSI